jgi:molybdopterin-guanine dinucleotide biosynthesis protein A
MSARESATRRQAEPPAPRSEIAGVILAGGLARRMEGRSKALLDLGGRPLISRVIERLKPQVASILLNANADLERLAGFGLPVRADVIPGHAGPLAGILTGLRWARETSPAARWLLSVAVDTPFFPADLAIRLHAACRQGADLACAASGGRRHPVFGLWPLSIADDLERALTREDLRKIDRFTSRYRLAVVDFPVEEGCDPFFNINHPEDLRKAETLLALCQQKTAAPSRP